MNPAAILVVDDEEKILDIVESYLKKDGYQVFTAKTGEEALSILQNQPISLLLLDLMLPDITGEEICRRIRKSSDIPIIMMTAKISEESIIHGLRIGADDYVTKPFSPRQLMARVGAALRRSGDSAEGKHIFLCGTLTVDAESRIVTKSGQPVALTPNEYKILALLISRPKKVFSRDEIIASIMTDAFDGFDRAIDSHIKNLRQKIEDDPRAPTFIVTVYGAGYRFGGEAES